MVKKPKITPNVPEGVTLNKEKVPVSKLIFYICLLIFPIAQFIVFYIIVNFNGITLSFKKYEMGDYVFAGFENYKTVFNQFFHDGEFGFAIKNSFITMGVDFVVIMLLSLLFSFYIAKKYPLHKFFRVMLFLPSIISSIVMVIIYRYFLEEAIPLIIDKIWGRENVIHGWLNKIFDTPTEGSFLNRPGTDSFIFIMFYYVWISFGSGILLYSGAMSGISEDVIEAGYLDGATGLKEFFYITIPGIWPTIVVLTISKLTAFFTNQLGLFSFYGSSALPQMQTIGYYLFKNTYGNIATMDIFPKLAAMGIVFTIVIAPVTLGVKYLMEHFGPREE